MNPQFDEAVWKLAPSPFIVVPFYCDLQCLNDMKYIVFIVLLMSCVVKAEVYKWVDDNGNTHFSDSKPESGGAFQTLSQGKTENYSNLKDKLNSIANRDIEIIEITSDKLGPLVKATSRTISSYKDFFSEISENNIGYPMVRNCTITSNGNSEGSVEFLIIISDNPKDHGNPMPLSSLFASPQKPFKTFESDSELKSVITKIADGRVEINRINVLNSKILIEGLYTKNSEFSEFLQLLKTEGIGEAELKEISPTSFSVEIEKHAIR